MVIKRNNISEDDILLKMMDMSVKGYNCSQIMMGIALSQIKQENADLIRSMAGLGNGCGFFNETCGILTSAASILSLYAGKGDDLEKESDKLLPMLQDLGDWFQNETMEKGGTKCKEIVGDSVGTPEGKNICGDILFKTYKKTDSILMAYDF